MGTRAGVARFAAPGVLAFGAAEPNVHGTTGLRTDPKVRSAALSAGTDPGSRSSCISSESCTKGESASTLMHDARREASREGGLAEGGLDEGGFFSDVLVEAAGDFLVEAGDFLVEAGDFLVEAGDFLVEAGDFLIEAGDFFVERGAFLTEPPPVEALFFWAL